jgi:hypothetical protein
MSILGEGRCHRIAALPETKRRMQWKDTMKRRELLKRLTAVGFMAAHPSLAAVRLLAGGGTANAESGTEKGNLP